MTKAPVQPAHSPPLSMILPFFLVAPLGLVAAGLLALESGREMFVAINARQTVAITHALVLGWVSTFMMGACYQLGPAVLGGQLLSGKLVRIHLIAHCGAIGLFVWSFAWFNVTWVGIAGSLLFLSVALFLVNAGHAIWTASSWTIPRAYLAVSTVALALGATIGLTFAGNLEHHWFPTTHGRLAAHAHLGLVGWIALTVMGVSYQLVPMFSVAARVKPRFATPALVVTGASLLLFAAVMAFDPARDVRMTLAVLLAVGPSLWAIDQVRILRGRARRRMDIHGRATVVSLCFLALTVLLGIGAAWGTPFTAWQEPARWPLAYALAGVAGWAGTVIIANSFKIVPFLVWYHRYRPRMGKEPVPVVHDIYDERLASAVLVLHCMATLVLVAGALSGELAWIHAGGVLIAVAGVTHLVSLLAMLLPKRSSRRAAATLKGLPS